MHQALVGLSFAWVIIAAWCGGVSGAVGSAVVAVVRYVGVKILLDACSTCSGWLPLCCLTRDETKQYTHVYTAKQNGYVAR